MLAGHANRKFLSVSLGFSAGVMIYVSMVELLDTAGETLREQLGGRAGSWAAAASFFGGIALIAIIDKLIPSEENPHELKSPEEAGQTPRGKLMRMGLMTALAIAVTISRRGWPPLCPPFKSPTWPSPL